MMARAGQKVGKTIHRYTGNDDVIEKYSNRKVNSNNTRIIPPPLFLVQS